MSNTNNLLRVTLKARKMSQAALLRELDDQLDPLSCKYSKFSQSRLNHYVNNNRQPDLDTARRILSAVTSGSKGPRLALLTMFPSLAIKADRKKGAR